MGKLKIYLHLLKVNTKECIVADTFLLDSTKTARNIFSSI